MQGLDDSKVGFGSARHEYPHVSSNPNSLASRTHCEPPAALENAEVVEFKSGILAAPTPLILVSNPLRELRGLYGLTPGCGLAFRIGAQEVRTGFVSFAQRQCVAKVNLCASRALSRLYSLTLCDIYLPFVSLNSCQCHVCKP